MIKKFIKEAKKGNPVFITDVREGFSDLGEKHQQKLSCVLNMVDGTNRLFELKIPALKKLETEQLDFVRSYIRAEVYNILSALGGVTMTVYIDTRDPNLVELAEGLNETFGIGQDLASRKGYARCVNVIDRMLSAIY